MDATLSPGDFQLAEKRSLGKTYPVYVNNLKEAGVKSYTVTVANHDRRIFSGIHDQLLEIPGNVAPKICADQFNLHQIKAALHRTQTGQSDYKTFMEEIAEAGVHFYTADLLNRTVKYFGKTSNNFYEESIPNI